MHQSCRRFTSQGVEPDLNWPNLTCIPARMPGSHKGRPEHATQLQLSLVLLSGICKLFIWRATSALISLVWKKLTRPLFPAPAADVPARAVGSMQAIDLLGAGWRLSSEDGKHHVTDAQLPAHALQILHQAGCIEDPLAGCGTVMDPSLMM